MADAVDEAARQLQEQLGDEPISTGRLQREIERIGGYSRGAVIPSDFCYNLVNQDAFSFRHPVLVHIGHGRFRYVGPAFPYTGPVYWRPKGAAPRQVGSWHNGVLRLDTDPRE